VSGYVFENIKKIIRSNVWIVKNKIIRKLVKKKKEGTGIHPVTGTGADIEVNYIFFFDENLTTQGCSLCKKT